MASIDVCQSLPLLLKNVGVAQVIRLGTLQQEVLIVLAGLLCCRGVESSHV